ncbi:Bromodomain adjacent to zinc finger domain protein 2B [Acipenser ruthenus]|uniref:WD repeat, SAM and U-box domain-containing protein 1 n=1 Tax=Acipenser ruthenus TaxID=7906 RepID=A0A444U8L0_ACIRT|nr:Bromodomain adjacent to zinc finger domain protein 2B [Acipenser ruthenus]
MESGERLASPPSASSSVPSSTATATAPSKGSLSTGATALSSTLTTCGHLFRAAGDQPFTLSTVSSAFPMVNQPVFGLYTTSSGRSEFGGLGTLGASAALATHPQLGPFPEWWRTSDAHARAGAAFFPPLLGIPPLFAAPVQNHDSSSFQSRTASKNGRGAQKGMNGAVNGSSITLPSGVNTSATAVTVLGSSGQTKVANSSGRDRKCNQEQTNSQLQDKAADKPKDKKLRKKLVDSSSNSDSESGSSSDTSSEGVLMQNVKEAKKDGQKAFEDKELQDKKTNQQRHFASDPETLKQPQVLSQQLPLVLQSSEAKEEMGKKHLSVIHSTGLTATTKPLALVTQARREASPKPLIPSPEILKTGNKNTTEQPGSQINDLRLKQEQFKLAFPVQLKKQQELYKNQKKVASALPSPKPTTDSPASQKLTPANINHSNLFLSNTLLGHHQPNGVIQSAIQDAPLALTTKSRSQPKPSNKQVLNSSSTSFPSPVDLCTKSESNFDSDSDGSEDDEKDHEETETDTEGERTPLKLKLNKTAPSPTNCTPLNLQVIKAPNSAPSALLTGPGSPAYHNTPSSSYTHSTSPGSAKRRRVTDERELRIPLEYGWQREARIREIGGRLQGEVAYYAPCGKKLRQYPEVMKYLTRNGITDITRDNFSFSAKIRVGDFYEARDGPQGMQWILLNKEEVIPRIQAMEGRRGRPPNTERTRSGDGSRMRRRKGRPPNVGASEIPSNIDAKLIRKLEAQEIARQAAQIKLMRKLEKQALARAAKEARKQQAIMAAEEKRKQKEQIKILKQQEKIKRIQQIRMEKELRAQQILEAKRKKKEEAANAKISEAEKRTKEKEMRRQQAVLLKHQERERRRQHMMLMKAMDARKKAEEKERLKQEKKDEKRLNKERKLELRRLELEIAKELKKPNEDMCLADHKPLPELNRISGLVLSGSTFSDCLMVVQFLRNFGKVLGFDISVDVPHLSVLQEGLLNVGDSMGEVQDLLVRLLSAVVCDPGLPPGCRAKTALGDHLTNIGINRDNVSEILQIYMEAHCGQTELTESLETKAFQAHTPTQKASILAFLVNELACSKSVVSEIDKNIDHMSNLRRDKWIVEGKLRKLRIIHAKKTGKRDTSGCVDGGEEQALGTPTPGRKRKRKGGDSDDDDDDEDDSDEQGDEEEDDEDDGKKGKKVEACEDEDDGYQTTSVEELEKQIEKLTKQQSQFRRKLFEASHSLRSMMFGQDRYKRRYWVLPQCGGVFVEALESGEESREKGKEKDNPNLFLQKPGSFSKLSKLLEVAKMSPESDTLNQKPNGSQTSIPTIIPSPSHTISQSALSPQPAVSQGCSDSKPDSTLNLFNPLLNSPGKFYNSPLLPNDQLLRVLTDKSGQWFSLLPRTPCDDTSVTHPTMPTTSFSQSSTMTPKSPSPSPAPPLVSGSLQNPVGLNPFALSALQMKPGLHLMGLPFCGWPSGMLSPNLPFTSSPLPHALNSGFGATEGNPNPFLAASVSTSKSESPVPQNEKPPSAPSPTIEVAKPVDHPCPRPIPKEMQTGWWRVTDAEELRTLAKVLHLRGIREKALQKQIQKHMDYISQACSKNRDVAIMEINDNEENQVTQETLESWCVEEQAMDMDIAILQQVEELERRVASASLQVKGWIYPEPHSEREDLVYYEHKPFAKLQPEEDNVGEKQDCSDSSIVRHINNPLDIAVTRLAELERNIERRGEEDIAPGLKVWRKALSEVRSAAQVALCIQQLQKSIAWEKSIMKVYCQICRKGDNEELLLLCDGCDKGCHTYCHRPKITTIPEGDWFCPACIAKASGQSPRSKKLQIRGVRKGNDMKCSKKLSVAGDVSEDDAASTSSTPKKGGKEPKKRKGDENTSLNQTKQESSSCVKKAKTARDNAKDLALCSLILSELETHEDAWPFLLPVNLKLVSGYKKVIKKPMAFATIREKLGSSQIFPSITLKMATLICSLVDHSDDVNWCAFSSTCLATCSLDKTIRLYSIKDFSELPFSPLNGHGYAVHSCCFSSTGMERNSVYFQMASCGQDNNVKIWMVSQDVPSGCEFKLVHTLNGQSAPVLSCAFSSDGQLLVSGYVTACAFAPDMPFIATGSMDKTVTVWRIEDGTSLGAQSRLCVSEWSEEAVSVWLCEEGLGELVTIFKANNIDGSQLLSLNKEIVTNDLNIESLGLRNKVIRKIEELKEHLESICTGIPDEFLCPISRELMKDPVIASDGYSYEREAIESWIHTKKHTSPMTNLPLKSVLLTPNRTLKMAISRWKNCQ